MASKQAELRRLMKLQREKKEQEELQQQQAPPKSILKKAKKSTQPDNGLSTLLTGYDSDESSDSKEGEATRVSWPSDDAKLETTHEIEPLEPKTKRARFTAEIETAQQSPQPPSKQQPVDAAVDPETWNEFQSLLNDDDGGESSKADDEPIQKESAASTTTSAEKSVILEEADESPVDTSIVEQASYEARIAQLRLKAAARRTKKAQAVVPTYTPELAISDEKQKSSDELTPLEILRLKRQKAKRLAEEEDS